MKQWSHLKGENSWTMFKVLSEFVEGFETMNNLGPCISIFGSARVKESHPHYELARRIAARLTEEGFGIITGGDQESWKRPIAEHLKAMEFL